LGIVLTLPTLTGGLYFDDYILKLSVRGHPAFADIRAGKPSFLGSGVSPLDLFTFVKAGRQDYLELIDRFAGIWGMADGFEIAFLRPLSSLTHAVDFWLWPDEPWTMHLENVIWYGALVFFVSRFYRRRLGPGPIAGLAMILFAVDDAHGMTVGWISNRNALIAGVFGVLCLLAHDRWRRDGWRPGLWLGPLLLAIALMAGESAIAVCAYLGAYALILEGGSWRVRVGSLTSYALVVVIWRFIYSYLGYGVAGTDLYVDPSKEPTIFLVALVERLPVLLLGQFALPPSELWILVSDEGRVWLAIIGAAAVGVILLLTVPLFKRSAEMRFFGLGALLATVPICAAFPFDRLLIFVGIGAMALVAGFLLFLVGGEAQARSKVWKLGAYSLATVWFLIHVVIAPVLLPGRALLPSALDRVIGEVSATLPNDETWTQQTLVVVNTPDISFSFHVMARKASNQEPLPAYVRFLSHTDAQVIVERADERTLTLRWPAGLFARPIDRFFRGRRFPFSVGDEFHMTGFTARVTEVTEDGRPSSAQFEFAVPLEDASLRWFCWVGKGYTDFVPPRVGETRTLPAVDPDELFRRGG
jgi:hypothetical protein